MAFSEYPKAMKHPQARPAILSRDTIGPDGHVIHAPPGKPAMYPDVFVNNKDQELMYASKGYIPNGVSDPEAYMSSVLGADAPNTHEHVEFPKWLYQLDEDSEMVSCLINDKDAQDKLQGLWYATPDDAEAAGPSAPKAKAAGKKVSKQTSDQLEA